MLRAMLRCVDRDLKKKKKSRVVDVREKKVRVSMKTNSNQELPKETKREHCPSTAPSVQPLRELQGRGPQGRRPGSSL